MEQTPIRVEEAARPVVLVRGCGDVGSAVAHAAFAAGYRVLMHDRPRPAHPRRGMAFCDALFEGVSVLEQTLAKRGQHPDDLPAMLRCRRAVPVFDHALAEVLARASPAALIDARMRKRQAPEAQRGLAPLVIGLGPNLRAGDDVDVVIETQRGERLGEAILSGTAAPLAGEPSPLGGYRRERFVYARLPGVFRTDARIGQHVAAGETVGRLGLAPVHAPMSGILRGLSHDGAEVEPGAKVLEVDPSGDLRNAVGLGRRPTAIACGVLRVLAGRLPPLHPT